MSFDRIAGGSPSSRSSKILARVPRLTALDLPPMKRPVASVVVASILSVSAGRAAPGPERCGTAPTVDFIFRAFRDHPVLFLGEQHRRREFHEFLDTLLRDGRFPTTVDDVVVEFGSGRLQSVADRYVAGENVSEKELERIWRDTTQIVTWDSPLYHDFFVSIRKLNSANPRHQVRVLLGEPPIDWAAVRTAADYGRYAERDRFFANVVETEVLARHHRGLLIYGGEHVLRTAKAEPSSKHPGAGELVRQERPGASYAIYTVPPKRPLAGLGDCYPIAVDTSGEIGSHAFSELMEPGLMVQRIVEGKSQWVPMSAENSPPIREKADALLWLGPKETTVPGPSDVWSDQSYLAEVHRRAKIMSDFYGFDLAADLPKVEK